MRAGAAWRSFLSGAAGLGLALAAVGPASAQFPQNPRDPLANTTGGALQQVSPFLTLNDPTRRLPLPPPGGQRFVPNGRSTFRPGFTPGGIGFFGSPGFPGGFYSGYAPVTVYGYGGYPVYIPGERVYIE